MESVVRTATRILSLLHETCLAWPPDAVIHLGGESIEGEVHLSGESINGWSSTV